MKKYITICAVAVFALPILIIFCFYFCDPQDFRLAYLVHRYIYPGEVEEYAPINHDGAWNIRDDWGRVHTIHYFGSMNGTPSRVFFDNGAYADLIYESEYFITDVQAIATKELCVGVDRDGICYIGPQVDRLYEMQNNISSENRALSVSELIDVLKPIIQTSSGNNRGSIDLSVILFADREVPLEKIWPLITFVGEHKLQALDVQTGPEMGSCFIDPDCLIIGKQGKKDDVIEFKRNKTKGLKASINGQEIELNDIDQYEFTKRVHMSFNKTLAFEGFVFALMFEVGDYMELIENPPMTSVELIPE